MEININGTSNNSSVKVAIIKLLIAVIVGFCMLAGSLGGYILKTFLPMYIDEMDVKKRSLEPITATVISVDREYKNDSTIGYMRLSYEYNNKEYIYDMKYYDNGSFHYSTAEDGDNRPSRDDKDKSDAEYWEELKEMVGTKQEVFIDPAEPDKLFFPSSEDTIKILRVMVIVGFALIAVIIVVIILVIIIGKKIIKKVLQKIETANNSIS